MPRDWNWIRKPDESDYYKGEIRGEDRDPRGWYTTSSDRVNVIEGTDSHAYRLIYPEQFLRLFLLEAYESFIIHRNVIVLLTSTHDHRAVLLLDELPASIRNRLFAIRAHKGGVSFFWTIPAATIPEGYRSGDGFSIPANPKERNAAPMQGDFWAVDSSEGFDEWAFSNYQRPDGSWRRDT